MKQYKIIIMSFTFSALIFFNACNNETQQASTVGSGMVTDLNAIVTELPEAPGHKTFKQYCMSCHSARYIQIQPVFPEKTWTALVTKMQKTFGAPIPDSSAKEIVQYLVAIKGKK